jgi:hypothetical protein
MVATSFVDMVQRIWLNETAGGGGVASQDKKIKTTGWAKNVSEAYKNKKKELLRQVDCLGQKGRTNITYPSRNRFEVLP